MIFNNILELLIFSGKIVISLANNFSMQKIPIQKHFWMLNFYLYNDFQNFCGTF